MKERHSKKEKKDGRKWKLREGNNEQEKIV